MEQDKIFVVVPVYKVELYLHRCIDSIINQTLSDFQLILVDDGSPDNCGAVCDEYAARDARIHVIHQENGGPSAARNAGIAYAMAHADPERDWISFIDSDDFVHPCYLEFLYRAAKEAGVEISSCGNVRTSESDVDFASNMTFQYDCLSVEDFWCRRHTYAVVAWGKLYRLRLFEEVRYPVGKLYEDNFTTHKLLFCCGKVTVTGNQLYCWCTNPDSITRAVWSPNQLDAMEALEAQLAFLKDNGYTKAYKTSAKELFRHCVKQSIAIRLVSPTYDHLIPGLLQQRTVAFKRLVAELGLIRTVTYWYEIRVLRSIKRILRNETVFSYIKRKLRRK